MISKRTYLQIPATTRHIIQEVIVQMLSLVWHLIYLSGVDFVYLLKNMITLHTIGLKLSNQWNRAKSLRIIDVCKLRLDANNQFDCYGNEYRLFVYYVRCLQEFTYYCSNKECSQFNVSIEWATEIFLKRHQEKSVRYLTLKCHHCSEILFIRFTLTPPW